MNACYSDHSANSDHCFILVHHHFECFFIIQDVFNGKDKPEILLHTCIFIGCVHCLVFMSQSLHINRLFQCP